MQFYSLSDKGLIRSNNQDSCYADNIGKYTVLILADGMGGHKGGETASRCAVEVVSSTLCEKLTQNLLPGQIGMLLSDTLEKANTEIYNLSKSDEALSGMGTTLDACVIDKDNAYIAHIGDSRVYKVTPTGEIRRLTKDHSLVEYMVSTGAITPQQAVSHPQKNVITRALGISQDITADIFHEKLAAKDRLLLCSDGLTNMVDEDTIAKVLTGEKKLESCGKKLVKLANQAGGNDNITVVVAQV
ncbi:MAG: Stp1/IreP family PP2C-type Ser/Thr phosphatase [Clostridia bacterium]|nr:Stp1/IreP family PP2C-type Ser/Thr phosphatase [Clostridia bacterium]